MLEDKTSHVIKNTVRVKKGPLQRRPVFIWLRWANTCLSAAPIQPSVRMPFSKAPPLRTGRPPRFLLEANGVNSQLIFQ